MESAAGSEPPPAADPGTVREESWDRNRYTAVIEEPDWWTPDAAGWDDPLPQAEPIVPSAVPAAPDERGEDLESPDGAVVEASESQERSRPDEPESEPDFAASIGLDAPLESEETMLWFGSRPSKPADEIEVASASSGTSAQARDSTEPPSLPGIAELDEALASLGAQDEGSAAAEPEVPSAQATPSATAARTVELPSPASRAYRRLRRIFPN